MRSLVLAVSLALAVAAVPLSATSCGITDPGNVDRLSADWHAFQATLPPDLIDQAMMIGEDIASGDYLGAVTQVVNLFPQITKPEQLAAANVVWADLKKLIVGQPRAAELVAEGNMKLAAKTQQLRRPEPK